MLSALYRLVKAIIYLRQNPSRKGSAKAFARAHGFEWLDKELMDCLYLRGTSLPSRDAEVSNSMKGEIRGVEASIFDFTYQLNENSEVCHTVAAFRNEGALKCSNSPSQGQKELHIDLAGDWLICYDGNGRVPTDQLLVWSEKMYDVAARLVAAQPQRAGSTLR